MKAIAISAAILLAATAATAFAGVTPNTATTTLQRSGAKIAPAKTSSESQEHETSESQSGDAK